jgi:hypothetical protein
VKLLMIFKRSATFTLLSMDCVFCNTLYTKWWCLMNGKMEYPLHSLSLEKAKKMTSIWSYNHYHIKCQMIGCHLLYHNGQFSSWNQHLEVRLLFLQISPKG